MLGLLSSPVWATSLLLLPSVRAYIPAAAVNQTDGIARSDQSKLDFVWVRGTYSSSLSLQLTAAANQSDFFPSYWANGGIDRGALVHFSEDMVKNNDTSDTPWIAFISCDSNSTAMSTEDDIFTLARDRGAMAALLYSNKSEGCQIEPEYLANFEQVLDVFTTHNRDDAVVIESQFEQHCDPAFQNFAPSLLNTSYESVTSLLNGTYPTSNTYLVAILTAFNATATVPVLTPTSSATPPNSTGGGGGSKPGTSLAMIILYAITGLITFLFCVVIISGAIRAIRHPERYGPRRGRPQPGTYPYNFDDPQYGGPDGSEGEVVTQTRTAGLAKAIVDTFPIIKFVSKNKRHSGGGGLTGAGGGPPMKLASETWELPPVAEDDRPDQEYDQLHQRRPSSHTHSHSRQASSSSRPMSSQGPRRGSRDDRSSYHSTYQSPISSASPSRHGLTDTVEDDGEEVELGVPVLRSGLAAGKGPRSRQSTVEDERAMGKAGDAQEDGREHEGESCAICLLEFEEGDDLRVLPCEGQHRFHQECIDNWLIDISGNCPLCRKDFSLAPASASTSSLPLTADPPASAVAAGNPLATRVTRYLANVRSNRRERRISGGAAIQQASGLSSMLAGTAMH